MALNKQQLEVVNQTNFPDNNSKLITPALLRDFNTDMIDAIQLTGSYATTGSNTFVGNQTITGNLSVSGVISASVLHVQTETASVIYSSGSNQLGDELTDIQTLSGSVKIQGQLLINGVPLTSGSQVNTGSLVTTASFNAYTQSTNLRLNSLETNSASVNVSISNLNTTTASLSTSITNINSFTQSQAALNGTFATTGSNTFTGNQIIDRASKLYTNGIYWTDVTAGFNNLEIINQGGGNLDLAALNGGKVRIVNTPLILTGSALTSSNDISTSANIYAANLTGSTLPSGVISGSAQITALGFVSSSVTASSLITASLSGQTLTFTKGNGTTFGIVIPDVSGSDITALNAFTASQLLINTGYNTFTSSTNTSISALNQFTASQSTASIVTSITNLNNFTSSANGRLNNIETTTASLLVETQNLELFSASALISISNLNASSASQQISINNLNAATSSYVTETESGSFLLTASFDNNTRDLTFTKGNNTTFAVNIPDVSGSTFNTGSLVTTSSFNAYTSSNDQRVTSLESNSASVNISISNLNANSASQQISINSLNAATSSYVTSAITASSLVTASFSGNTLTFTKGDNSTFGVVIPDVSGSTINTGSFVTTSSFNSYTSSTDSRLTNIESTTASLLIETNNLELFSASALISINALNGATGSYATTGSNTFTGDQTLIDNAGNFFTISDASGSMMLVAKGFTSASAHISASSAGIGNIIFKTNSNTADTIISGSGNIFTNPTAVTTGFKRYVGGSNNIYSGPGSVPQISASMGFSPTMTTNYLAGNMTMRGPVSSSATTIQQNNIVGTINIGSSATLHAEKLTSGLSMAGNIIAGTLNILANQAALTASTGATTTTVNQNNLNGTVTLTLSSSCVTFTGNTINDGGFILTNNYFSASAGLGIVTAQRNTIAGNGNLIIVSGSLVSGTSAQPQFIDNFIGGASNIIYSEPATARVSGVSSANSHYKSIMYGNGLIITASMLGSEIGTHGSAFFGRYNSVDGNKDFPSDTVFAVGTGTSTSVRKTGFLIDSGSNTYVEGSLNVSGSTSLTGSLTIQSGSAFFANGNRQFNVGTFSSLVTQSGSANVSQSMNFEVTDISSGVSIASNSRITLANSGTYNIQFSAQVLADTGADTVWIWLKKNGTNVSSTSTKLVLANNEANVAAWNFVVDAAASDYFELAWQSSGGHTKLFTEAAASNYPSIPSVILTVTQVR